MRFGRSPSIVSAPALLPCCTWPFRFCWARFGTKDPVPRLGGLSRRPGQRRSTRSSSSSCFFLQDWCSEDAERSRSEAPGLEQVHDKLNGRSFASWSSVHFLLLLTDPCTESDASFILIRGKT